jgi:hypothetical protein
MTLGTLLGITLGTILVNHVGAQAARSARSQQELARHDEARQEAPETLPHAARHRNPLLGGLSGRPGIFCYLLVGPFATRPPGKVMNRNHIYIYIGTFIYIHTRVFIHVYIGNRYTYTILCDHIRKIYIHICVYLYTK